MKRRLIFSVLLSVFIGLSSYSQCVYTVSEAVTNIDCNGWPTGSIDLSLSGPPNEYTYSWSNGDTTEDVSNLFAGQYSVLVSDSSGCDTTHTFIITEPSNSLAINITKTSASPVTCCTDGTATVHVAGGTPPYSYLWSNGDTTATSSNLGLGAGSYVYNVVVTDANGCALQQNVVIDCIFLCDDVVSIDSIESISCKGDSTGAAAVSISVPQGPGILYHFVWRLGGVVLQTDSNVLSSMIINVPAGIYIVEMIRSDCALCQSVMQSIAIPEPIAAISISTLTVQTPYACDWNSGVITANASGGIPPYSYTWERLVLNVVQETYIGQTISGLHSDTYRVLVTDANGCLSTRYHSLSHADCIGFPTISFNNTQVGCNGNSDGSIGVTVSGTNPPYTYLWSDGDTTANRTGLSPGVYSVTVSDVYCCSSQSSTTITQPNPLSASAVVGNAYCNGGSTGAINLTVTGGTQPYSYAWSNGPITEDQNGLPAGTYSVTITDANGCTITTGATITQPANSLSVSISKTDATGSGGCNNGSATAIATGGTSPYTYFWSDGLGTSATVNNVFGAATYSVTVTDANGCSVSQGVTLDCNGDCDIVVGISSITDVLCTGGNNAGATVSASSAADPSAYFTFVWRQGTTTLFTTTGATISTLTGVPAGVYIVSVTNDSIPVINCQPVEQSVTITQPLSGLQVTASTLQDQSTVNGTEGSVTVSVTGGTSPYTYLWDANAGNVTTQTVNGLLPGTYCVTVNDANGCVASQACALVQNFVCTTSPSVSILTTNVSCSGNSDGQIVATVNGGTSPYTFNWTGNGVNVTSQNQSNLEAGFYNVVVTDNVGCTTTANNILLTEPSSLVAGIAVTNVLCKGSSTGALNLTVAGGTSPYTFNWSNGPITEDQNSLSAGVYTVTVTDANGCTLITSATIEEPSSILSAYINKTNASASSGCSNGTATVQVNGGTPPYTYLWSDGLGTNATATNMTAPGTYTVNVTDANGCTLSESVVINCVSSCDAALAINAITNVTCNGGNNGSATISATSVANPASLYTFVWLQGNTPIFTTAGATSSTCTGVAAGTYVIVCSVDGTNCPPVQQTVTISEPPNPVSGTVITSQNQITPGGNEGAIIAYGSGGTPPYTYQSGANAGNATTPTVSGLFPGTYCFVITDANACSSSQICTVVNPYTCTSNPSIAFNTTNVTCNSGSNGTIVTTVSGGVAPYTYAWTGPGVNAFQQNQSNIGAGTFHLIVTDANGCQNQASITISEPSSLNAAIAVSSVQCVGTSTGALNLTAAGGTQPYSYAWSNGPATEDQNNIPAGAYSVLVTDANGCTVSAFAVINEPSNALSMNIMKSNATTVGGCVNGIASALASGGTPPYTFVWSDGLGTNAMTGNIAGPGTYTVVCTDAIGCSLAESVTVDCVGACDAALSIDIVNNVTCFGGNDGSATVSASSINNPGSVYTMVWKKNGISVHTSNGVSSSSITGASPGVYTISVTIDGTLCPAVEQNVIIGQPSAVSGNAFILQHQLTVAGTEGVVSAQGFGGTPPYSYLWGANAGNSTTQTVNGLLPGTYCVVATDVNGCASAQVCTIISPFTCTTSPVIGFNVTDVSCNGLSDGEIVSTVTDGTTPYTYAWSGTGVGAAQQNQSGLAAGGYNLIVTDAAGCQAQATATVKQADALSTGIAVTNIFCIGANTGALDLTVSGGNASYTYGWNNGGIITQDQTNLPNGTYTVVITDASGCVLNDTVTITEFSIPDSIYTTAISCNPLDVGIAIDTFINQYGCDSIHTINTTFSPTVDGIENITACDSTFANGFWYFNSSTFNDTLVGAATNGCDSITTFNITINTSDSVYITATSCNPLDTGLVLNNLTNQNGCDSVYAVYTSLLASDSLYTTATSCNPLDTGLVVNNLTNQNGCDSVYVVYTSLLASDSLYTTATSCNPLDTGLVLNNLTNQNGCDSVYVVYTSLLASDSLYTTATSCNPLDTGLVLNNLTNQNGCDSVYVVYTSLLASDSLYTTATSCNPLDTGLVLNNLTNQNGCDSVYAVYTSLLASDSLYTTATSCNPLDTGLVVNNLTNQNGCDSVYAVYTSLLASDSLYTTATSCNPLDTGLVVNNLTNQNGCDSVYIVYTSLLASDSLYTTATSCNPLDTGLVLNNLTNQNGCDSIYAVYTSLLASDSLYTTATSCNPLDTGLVVNNLTNQNGCDSVYVVYTSLLASDSLYTTATSCNPLDTGLVVNNLTNQNGCDSVYAVYTSLLASDSLYTTATSCNPLDTGLVVNNLTNQNGCDSVYAVYTSLLASDSLYTTATSCNPLDTGLVLNNLTNQNGCDSVYAVYTSLLASDSLYTTATSCNPLDTGLVLNNLTNQNGCDSVYAVYTSLLASDSVYVSASSCNPLDTGFVQNTFVNQNGCDSVHTVYTSFLTSDSIYVTDSSCNPIDTGLVTNNLSNQNGCDSVYTVYTSLIVVQQLITNNDSFTLFMNTSISANTLTNDTYGIVLNSMIISPLNGTIVYNPDGSFTYTPNPSFTGVDSFSYNVCNACVCDTAMVYLDIRGLEMVWPGDADNDGVADNNDVLILGQYFGLQDLARQNASITWQAEDAYAWGQDQIGGLNMAFADCDGLGSIDTADMYVVDSNYNLIHSKVDGTKSGNLYMGLELGIDTFYAGDTLILKVNLGLANDPGTDIYGIAYTIDFDNTIVSDDYFRLDDSNSWLTPNTNKLSFKKPLHGLGQIDVAQTNTDAMNQSGFGEIASISVVIEDDLHGKDLLILESYFNLRNVRVISLDGTEIGIDKNDITFVATQEDTTTGIRHTNDLQLKVYPNPFESSVEILFEEQGNYSIDLYAIDGKKLLSKDVAGTQTSVELGFLSQGVYYIFVSNDVGRNRLKIVKH